MPQDSQAPPRQAQPTDEEAAALIAALLGGSPAASASSVAAALLLIAPSALTAAPQVAAHVADGLASLAASHVPPAPAGRAGVSERASYAEELLLRGFYAVSALKRLAASPDKAATLEREKRYFDAHLAAREARSKANRAVDAAASIYGPVLGWYATLDERTTPDCRTAHGRNFRVQIRPRIGLPGRVHARCRCKAGPPYPNASLLA